MLTYNTALHFPGYADFLRADKLRLFLIHGDWDIIGLCEVYHPGLRKVLLEDQEIMEKYPHRVYALSKHGNRQLDNGTVILSKYEIKSSKRYQYENFHDVWYNKLLSPKDAIFAEIIIKKISIGVFVTHLQWGNTEVQASYRKKHIFELKEFIQSTWGFDRPLIVMGDFNTHGNVEGEDYKFLKQQLDKTTDWWMVTNNIMKHPGYTWDPENTKVVVPFTHQRLDYIFSNDFFQPVETNLVKFKSSLRNIFWKPKVKLSKKEKIWFVIARLLRIITVPLLFTLIIFFDLYRAIRRLPLIIFLPNRDLSDHYGVEGRAEMKSINDDN